MKLPRWAFAAAVLTLGLLAGPARGGSCFQMLADAKQVLSPRVGERLIWARAEEGTGIDPKKWSFLFYDPSADENGRHIVVINGNVTQIEQGFVELDHARLLSYKRSEIMRPSKLLIDSDGALSALLHAGKLAHVAPSTVHYELVQSDDRSVPVWNLTLYVLQDGRDSLFCTAHLSAATGHIFSMNFHHSATSF